MKRGKRAVSVSVDLSKADVRLLKRLSFKARRSGGRKLATNAILRALIRTMRELDVDLAGVKSAPELKRRLLAARRRRSRRRGRK